MAVCQSIILIKLNLCHQQVIDDDICEACGLGKENRGHLFWECKATREVWVQLGISFEAQGVRYNEFVDLVWYLMFVQQVGNDILEVLSMIAWSMQHNRNVAKHRSPQKSATQVVQKVRVLLEEFQTANHSISQPKRTPCGNPGQL